MVLTLRPLLYGLLGVLSALFAITLMWAIQAHQHFHSDSRADSQAAIIDHAVIQQLRLAHKPYAVELARVGASLPAWRAGVANLPRGQLDAALNEAFGQELFTTGLIQLAAVTVLGPDLNVIAEQRVDGQSSVSWESWFDELRLRSGIDARRVVSRYLHDLDGHTVHTVVHPIGSFRISGYLAVTTLPNKALSGITELIDGQITIVDRSGATIIDHLQNAESTRSVAGFDPSEPSEVIELTVHSPQELPLFDVRVRSFDPRYAQAAAWLQNVTIGVAILVTLAGLVAATVILRMTVFRRATAMSLALQRIVAGDIGVDIPNAGNDEIGRMAQDIMKAGQHVERVIALQKELANNNAALEAQIAERKKAEARIEYLAHHDDLTGLPNRVLFRDRLKRAMDDRRSEPNGSAVLLLDLDRFKLVNDTLGHAAGDMLLQQVAGRIKPLIRSGDTLARLGGDEFVLLMCGVSRADEAADLASRIIQALTRSFDLAGKQATIGVSIGIAMSGVAGRDLDEIISNADLALYRSKSGGRNCYSFFDLTMDAEQQTRRRLEDDLAGALASDSLEVHYQHQWRVDADNAVRFGAEALVRWRHPTLGMLSPGQFIPVAETSGLIVALGNFVLRQACRTAALWPRESRVSVNLSPSQLQRSDLVPQVKKALGDAGLAPERLVLEVTETVVLDSSDVVRSNLAALCELGTKLSMDDFGSGHSSLHYLQKYQFDEIKVDRSFLENIQNDRTRQAILLAITDIGAALQSRVIVEGVETAEQVETLLRLGCQHMQGYFLARPMPAEMLDETPTSQPWRKRFGETMSLGVEL